MTFRALLFVGTGAAIGALSRWMLLTALPTQVWTLVAINILGALAMGLFRPGPFWGKGVFGGFTSFSTFTADLLHGAQAGVWLTVAIPLFVVTVIGCVGGWVAGYVARQWWEANRA